MAVEDIRSTIEQGRGPRTTASFIDEITSRLGDRMWPVIDDLEDRVAEVEDVVLTTRTRQTRTVLATIRQQAIGLRRFIGPQREALARLSTVETTWMDDVTRRHIRESFDRFTRGVEDLDAIRERAAVVQDELTNHLGDEMNRRMYALSLIAGVFLPLGFITGLLGINVGGIPGSDISWAFLAVCVVLVLIVGFEVFVFRRLKWF
jgi:zinc transporter